MADETVPQLEKEWRESITRNIEQLAAAQRVTQEAVAALKGDVMPRHEIAGAMERMVSNDVYQSDRRSDDKRFQQLENSPGKVREWLNFAIAAASMLIGGGGCLISLVLGLGGLAISIGVWITTH